MANFQLTTSNQSAAIISKMKRLSKTFKEAEIAKLLRKAGRPMLNEMKKNSPVDDGVLKKAIGFKSSKGNVTVGPQRRKGKKDERAYHAWLVEYGPRSRPFLRRSFENTKTQVDTNIIKEAAILFKKWEVTLPNL